MMSQISHCDNVQFKCRQYVALVLFSAARVRSITFLAVGSHAILRPSRLNGAHDSLEEDFSSLAIPNPTPSTRSGNAPICAYKCIIQIQPLRVLFAPVPGAQRITKKTRSVVISWCPRTTRNSS